MTTIHFIRHGSVKNPDNIYYGRLAGFPLSDEGVECIRYTAKRLNAYPINYIYHSPLLRTEQSAEILAEHLQAPRMVDERLIELASFFEGHPRGAHTRVEHYPPVKAGYAETMAEIYERMSGFVVDRAQVHPDSHIIAVSHGGPIRILEMGISFLPFNDFAYDDEDIPACGSDTIVTVEGDSIKVNRLLL